MKSKTIYLYAKMNKYTHQLFENCTNVTYTGPILSFTDDEGNNHVTSVPWEIEELHEIKILNQE